MVYEIWHKRTDGTWEMVEWGYGGTGKDRLAMYQRRNPKREFRLDQSQPVTKKSNAVR